ncbi:MAG: PP2C family protein-serine/threonine phosphatase [Oscillospiraceae bacterium]|nr:PP2C family protein-serine/threonine phosphatase [Oscillospiraceae bacterium]
MNIITRVKRGICNVIRDDGHRSLANHIFSNAITILIIVNVAVVVLDLLEVFSAETRLYHYIEVITVAVFTVEYILRLWTADLLYPRVRAARARFRYAFSPMSIVDIAAILPFYLPMAFPINMTIVRLLRLLRLLRILKLNRYSDAKTSEKILSSIKEAIILIDADHNYLSANEAANTMFPTIKNVKKYAPVSGVENWPAALTGFDENSVKDSIHFEFGEHYYKADVSIIYDREKLLRYIIIIQDITVSVLLEKAENERIQSELMIARKIQASMLPSVFPPFPERTEFDIFALMEPAKEVGGDFYDFFFIDENRLAVVMADVSGKGIPAALFMVNAKTQLKNALLKGKAALPAVLEAVNNLLCEGNDECMFVTVFFGVLDIPSGKFSYVNGGHDVPLIKQGGEKFKWLPTRPGMMPGFMEGTKYEQDEIELKKGDVLFLYTDGVTEAENPAKEILTEEKLEKIINECEHSDAKGLLTFLRERIEAFADGAEQSDDITMLALRIAE